MKWYSLPKVNNLAFKNKKILIEFVIKIFESIETDNEYLIFKEHPLIFIWRLMFRCNVGCINRISAPFIFKEKSTIETNMVSLIDKCESQYDKPGA